MFWYLFIFCMHSPPEPAETACDYAGWPILFYRPIQQTALAQTNAVQKLGEDSEKKEGEWTCKVEIRTRKRFLAVGEACMAIFWPALGFKGRTFVSSGFSIEGTWISASAVSQCRYLYMLHQNMLHLVVCSQNHKLHSTCKTQILNLYRFTFSILMSYN